MKADLAGKDGRWVWTVNIAAMLTGMSVFGGRPLVSYKAIALGAGPVELGILAASFAGLAAALAVPVGRWMDRRGGRVALLTGLVVLAAAMTLLAASNSVVALALSQLLTGAGHLAVVLGCQSLIMSLSAPNDRPRRIAAYTTATSLGQVCGPALVGGLAGVACGQSLFFLLAAAWTLAALWPALRLPQPPITAPPVDTGRASLARTLRGPGMMPALVGGVTGLLALDILVTYLPAYGEVRGLPVTTVTFALSLLALCQMLVRFGLRQMLDRFGPVRLMALSVLIPGLAIPLTAFPVNSWALMAIMAATGLALGVCQPTSLVLTVNSAPASARGLAMGVRIAGNRLSVFLLPAALGLTLGHAGVIGIFGGLAALLLGAGSYVAATSRTGDEGDSGPVRPPY